MVKRGEALLGVALALWLLAFFVYVFGGPGWVMAVAMAMCAVALIIAQNIRGDRRD